MASEDLYIYIYIFVLFSLSAIFFTMFGRVDLGKKNQFLDKAKSAREERAQEKYKESSLIKIQVNEF